MVARNVFDLLSHLSELEKIFSELGLENDDQSLNILRALIQIKMKEMADHARPSAAGGMIH